MSSAKNGVAAGKHQQIPAADDGQLLQLPANGVVTTNGTAIGFEDDDGLMTKAGKFSSRVMFNSDSVMIEPTDGGGSSSSDVMELTVEDEEREGWDSKTQFFMGVISYAVGFGNVWRFPFLLQKNGGGAFLIPYLLMMVFEGIPLFLIELGIGQRLRTGPVGVWNAIHPYLGGVGVSAAIVSYLVGLYYNVILTWVVYYLYNSFTFNLPWSSCPKTMNGSAVSECAKSASPTNYFWNRKAIDTSDSIGEIGNFTMHMTVCLVFAWFLIYLCVRKGVKSSGKVMYLTATFPYVVTTVFLIRSLMLEGATDGLLYMLTPDLSRLNDPEVWLEAATQIFYSMGLGFGGLIAFASYNPIKNNVKKDVIKLSFANLLTSLYTALVIFCVLGYMGHKNFMSCVEKDMQTMLSIYPDKFSSIDEIRGNISIAEYSHMIENDFKLTEFKDMSKHSLYCRQKDIIAKAAEGTGLAFVVFTEAILQFPFPPLWAVLFFMMLLMLGLGTMFGTLEGVITSLNDSKVIRLEKPVLTAILCGSACIIGLIFTTQAGQYWVALFDHFAGSYALMGVAFFEAIAVVYVYGYRRFVRDIEYMTGETVGPYWIISWRFISPIIMLLIFACSIVKSFMHVPEYSTYDSKTTMNHNVPYPNWSLFIAFGMVFVAVGPVPFIWFVRKFKIWKIEPDIPVAAKCLGTTPSTAHMLRSEISFNRMIESSLSLDQLPTLSGKAHANGATRSAPGSGKSASQRHPQNRNNNHNHHNRSGKHAHQNGGGSHDQYNHTWHSGTPGLGKMAQKSSDQNLEDIASNIQVPPPPKKISNNSNLENAFREPRNKEGFRNRQRSIDKK